MNGADNPENQKSTGELRTQTIPAPKANPNLHTFELFKDYTLPEWSAKPTKDFL